jgi:phage shock protein A
MLDQIVTDMRNQLARAKQQVAAAIADEKRLKDQAEGEYKAAQDWEQKAMLAIKEGRDDLAKQALVRQGEHFGHAQQLEATWTQHQAETEKLKNSLRDLNDKIEEAKRKRNLLVAKQKRAQAQRRIHETMSGLSDTSAFETFNRMAEKIEDEERRTLAEAEVTEAITGDTLESQFIKLEAGTGGADVEDRLMALKAEMGLIAPPKPADKAKQLGTGNSGARDADVEEISDAEAASIPEAQLLSEFDKLEKQQ